MEYLIPIVLVLLLVAGFVTYLVVNATKREPQADPDDPGAEGNPLGIVASDDAPAGDTTEHSGEQSGGETVRGTAEGGRPDAGAGGAGGFGGEAEGSRPTPRPESERLANRPR